MASTPTPDDTDYSDMPALEPVYPDGWLAQTKEHTPIGNIPLNDDPEPLFEPSEETPVNLYPIRYRQVSYTIISRVINHTNTARLQLWALYKAACNGYWQPECVDLQPDVFHWNATLTAELQTLLKNCMTANIMKTLLKRGSLARLCYWIDLEEARCFFAIQQAM